MPSKILIEVSKDSMQKVIPDIELDISAVTDSVHTGIIDYKECTPENI